MNIIDGHVPCCSLSKVVEPFFLSEAGAGLPAGQHFGEWRQQVEKRRGDGRGVADDIEFLRGVDELDQVGEQEVRMGVVSARTMDNAGLCRKLLEKGYKYILLEKPGANTAEELQSLLDFANQHEATIIMGYIKNVSSYVTTGQQFEKSLRSCHPNRPLSITLLHSNDFTEEGLPECFERNCEGALKNMAIHELALLATYWGVTAPTEGREDRGVGVKSVVCDVDKCDFREINGFEDFVRGELVVEIQDGTTIRVIFDRCGGAYSEYRVGLKEEGEEGEQQQVVEEGSWKYPGREELSFFEEMKEKNPDIMSYFLVQHDGYVTLKNQLGELALGTSDQLDERIARLETGVKAVELAESFQKIMKESCKYKNYSVY